MATEFERFRLRASARMGEADAAVGVRKAERLGQPRRLLAEEEPAVTRQVGLTVVLRGLGGGEPEVLLRFRVLREERGQIFHSRAR